MLFSLSPLSARQAVGHNYTTLHMRMNRAQTCPDVWCSKECKRGKHTFCFEIYQSRCFAMLNDVIAFRCTYTPAGVCTLSAVSPVICMPKRQASNVGTGLDYLWLILSSSDCPSQSVPALIMFGFGVSQTWNDTNAQPTQILYIHSNHTHSQMHTHTHGA